jgi:hypothetical protein
MKRKLLVEKQSVHFPTNSKEIKASIQFDKSKQSKGFANISSLVHSDEPFDLQYTRSGDLIILKIVAPDLQLIFNSLVFFKPSFVKTITCEVLTFIGYTKLEPKIYPIPKSCKERFFIQVWKEQCEKDKKAWKESIEEEVPEKENIKRLRLDNFTTKPAFDPKKALLEFNPKDFNFGSTEKPFEPSMFGKLVKKQGNARQVLKQHLRRSKRIEERKVKK